MSAQKPEKRQGEPPHLRKGLDPQHCSERMDHVMAQKRRVVVTGIGCLCANGQNAEDFFQNLCEGVSGIRDCTMFDASRLRSSRCGQISGRLPYRAPGYEDKTRFNEIADSVIAEAIGDSGLSRGTIDELEDRCVLSLATSVGANAHLIEYVDQGEKKDARFLACYPDYILRSFQGLGFKGPMFINTSACSAGTTAAATAFSYIQGDEADLALVVGVDPISEFSYYGFHSLGNISQGECMPFDRDRAGLLLGEGGAALIFEEYGHAVKRNAKIYCECFGYGLGNDAYHTTSPDPTGEGALRTMRMALDGTDVDASKIHYVNAHGTGTGPNDSMELNAIAALTPHCTGTVHVNAIKSMTGHCLGAAGTVELLSTVLAVKNDVAFPTPTLKNPIDAPAQIEVTRDKPVRGKLEYALSNSYAFAGNSASFLVGKTR